MLVLSCGPLPMDSCPHESTSLFHSTGGKFLFQWACSQLLPQRWDLSRETLCFDPIAYDRFAPSEWLKAFRKTFLLLSE